LVNSVNHVANLKANSKVVTTVA